MSNFIKNILSFFEPNDFEDDNYGWLTNQLGHYIGSFKISTIVLSIVLLFNSNPKFYGIPLVVSIFWILWETHHYIISKNLVDAFEDLFFELSGTLYFWLIVNLIPSEKLLYFTLGSFPFIIVTIWRYLKRL